MPQAESDKARFDKVAIGKAVVSIELRLLTFSFLRQLAVLLLKLQLLEIHLLKLISLRISLL